MPARPRAHDPQSNALHGVLRRHLETFLADRKRHDPDGAGLPAFVERELRGYLRCGVLAHGLAHFRCGDCNASRVVALSCKGRGFCPRCIGRRMTERADHLLGAVLPQVRVRQWVLSLPYWLRHRCAFDHDLTLSIWRIVVRAIETRYRRVASEQRRGVRMRGGSVTVIQRFGGDLRTNIHFHGLFLDGVYQETDGLPGFVPVRAPRPDDIEVLLRIIVVRIARLLRRRGIGQDDHHDVEPSALIDLQARSVLGRGTERCRPDEHDTEDRIVRRIKARIDGFDLDADVVVSPRRRDRLEHLCRYVLRPPFALDRLRPLHDGRIALELRRSWSDGTTHVTFEPETFLERLASLVPRPNANTILYHGVLSARSALRARVIPTSASSVPAATRNRTWAELMQRSFGLDVLACECGGRFRFVATLLRKTSIQRLLEHLDLESIALPTCPARAPPTDLDFGA